MNFYWRWTVRAWWWMLSKALLGEDSPALQMAELRLAHVRQLRDRKLKLATKEAA